MWRSIALCALLALAPSCIGDGGIVGPLPEPVWHPLHSFDLELVSLALDGEQTVITGVSRATPEGPETLTADNLDGSAHAQAEITSDGSFVIEVVGSPADTFRLDGGSFGIVDITSESQSGGAATEEAHLGCLLPIELIADGPKCQLGTVSGQSSRAVTIRNDCTSQVTVLDATIHYGEVGFDVQTDMIDTQIAIGQHAEINISVECDTAGKRRDLLFVTTDLGRVVVSLEAECQ